MTGCRLILPACVIAGIGVFAPASMAQEGGGKATVLDLTATVLDLKATVEDLAGSSEDISGEVRDKLARSGDIEVRESGDDLILSVASDVLFAFDSADLSGEAQRSLTDVSEVLAGATQGQVAVVGHTDAKGSDDYNLELSRRRAEAVASFLKDHDIPGDRLRVEGRGEAEPVAENEIDGTDNPDGRARNRRVEFVVPKAMLADQ